MGEENEVENPRDRKRKTRSVGRGGCVLLGATGVDMMIKLRSEICSHTRIINVWRQIERSGVSVAVGSIDFRFVLG